MRYVHFDNDVYERNAEPDGTGISDHDPPLATFELRGASTSTPGDVTGNVPATLALTLGTQPPRLGTFTPGVAQRLHGRRWRRRSPRPARTRR